MIYGNVYRYGFQGQEVDNEIKGNGNSVNYTYRMHDPRLGRFFAVDPLASKYPWNSVYAFSENIVISHIELEGLEAQEAISQWWANTKPKIINATEKTVVTLMSAAVFIGALAINGNGFEDFCDGKYGDVSIHDWPGPALVGASAVGGAIFGLMLGPFGVPIGVAVGAAATGLAMITVGAVQNIVARIRIHKNKTEWNFLNTQLQLNSSLINSYEEETNEFLADRNLTSVAEIDKNLNNLISELDVANRKLKRLEEHIENSGENQFVEKKIDDIKNRINQLNSDISDYESASEKLKKVSSLKSDNERIKDRKHRIVKNY